VKDTALALAGKIGSGKSTVAEILASRLGVSRVSFSSVVRRIARQRGLSEERAVLQNLGDELIANGWDSFCAMVLDQAQDGPPVIDAIRHTGAVGSLMKLLRPARLVVVYLDVPESIRMERLMARGLTPEQINAGDSHPNEVELPKVRRSADLVVMNVGPIDDVVEEVLRLLDR
jgi:dephospho-CoA kinase